MSTKLDDLDKKSYGALYKIMATGKIIAPEQCRSGRAWLGWSQQDLAARASVGVSTVKDFENGNRTPIANNLGAIQRALEAAGVRPVFDGKGRPTGIAAQPLAVKH